MTTPGGVPNLPVGALTPDNLAKTLQDTTPDAMKDRAVERFSPIFGESTGGSPALDLTPFGILTRLFAGFNSTVANADPNDIQGPEDLPGLLIDFIESLPVVGQFVDLLKAITGDYAGEDQVLSTVSQIFSPIRKVMQLITGITQGFPTLDQVNSTKTSQGLGMISGLPDLINGVTAGVQSNILGPIGSFINAILGFGANPIAAYTPQNPAIAALTGRTAALEAVNNPGSEGFQEHFNDPALSTNWTTVVGTVNIVDGAAFNGGAFAAARYSAKTLMTNRWHIQAVISFRSIYGGQSRLFGGANATLSAMYPALEVDLGGNNGDMINLVTLTGPSAGRILRDSFTALGNGKLNNGDVVALEYDPNLYSAGVGGYACFLNNGLVCDWAGADTGNREVGFQLNIQNNFFAGAGWDDLSAYDY